MKKTILLVTGLLALPVVTSASFTDIYGAWAERLLGNPTSMYEHMQSFSSYGQRSSINAEFSSPEGNGKAHLTTDFQIDKANNLQGTIALDASGSMGDITDSVSVNADVILDEGTLYVKPTIIQLPEIITAEEKVGFQLLDGKWLQINDETTLPAINLPTTTIDPILLNQQLSALVTTTPILTSTKELTRNGYEIHLVDIDPVGIESLVAGVVNTITSQIGLPPETALSLPPTDSLENMGMKTIGVIGKKGDEIKMGMIIKKADDPHHVVFLSKSTATEAHLSFRMIEKRTKNTVFNFSMNNDFSILGTQDMQINFGAAEDQIDLGAHLTTSVYDAGTEEITAPTGAILLSELMQDM